MNRRDGPHRYTLHTRSSVTWLLHTSSRQVQGKALKFCHLRCDVMALGICTYTHSHPGRKCSPFTIPKICTYN